MSGLLKNQLLKQLSKFTKNMSADQINLSAMKGEGDLMNLELDEIVLMNILDMPPWIRIYRAFCNKMTIKIQWMKLNTQPIVLHLDEVTVDMETCYYRPPSSSSSSSSRTSSKSAFGTGKYGYIEQVLDGISVSINAININFKSLSFQASFQMSQVAVDSCTPAWRSASLDHTRIKNQSEGSILIFKQVQWQAVRIEANALASWIATTPLRLIANQSKIRVTLKKNLSDSSVLTSRIELHMDDLLWVVTDSQLFAALSFVQDLMNIINTHPQLLLKDANPKPNQQQRRKPQPQKQQTEQHFHRKGEQYEELARQQQQQQHASLMLFNKFNISESSCHLIINRSEVHLSDDAHQENEGYRSHVEGGAMQLVIIQLEFSYYPWRKAGTSRSGWLHFNECSREAEMWFNKFLQIDGKLSTCVPSVNDPSRGVAFMMEECVVVSLEDFCLYRVSTQHDKSRSKPKKFLSSDKKRLILPQDMSTLHVDVTNYTSVGPSSELSSSMFITINPICLSVDYLSLVWLHTFILNVMKKAVSFLFLSVCMSLCMYVSVFLCLSLSHLFNQIIHYIFEAEC
ncbi:hypothetical protein HELRODRAFT_116796 [Helobdella robusta]|uniref:Uncharacterized protein n=1 Tax=Helobdella robusta TaxID=6412 RepID=T1EGI0_HELRO|nr:hypothetical protein HELRODRAFT_116796 [Helobdella robusta]ESO11357.1 hypothetical protein HELRODRAFT_116796 [Helobdella robusta]